MLARLWLLLVLSCNLSNTDIPFGVKKQYQGFALILLIFYYLFSGKELKKGNFRPIMTLHRKRFPVGSILIFIAAAQCCGGAKLMKKVKLLVFFVSLMLLCGCARVLPMPETAATEPEKTEIFTLPNSFLTFCGESPEDVSSFFEKLGSDYYTSLQISTEGAKLELTQQQRDRLITRNREQLHSALEEFAETNSNYHYEIDETSRKVNLYFDEKIPVKTHLWVITYTVADLGFNYILENNRTDWNVEVSVYNCHTDKLVDSFCLPDKGASYGAEEWKKSYEP